MWLTLFISLSLTHTLLLLTIDGIGELQTEHYQTCWCPRDLENECCQSNLEQLFLIAQSKGLVLLVLVHYKETKYYFISTVFDINNANNKHICMHTQ